MKVKYSIFIIAFIMVLTGCGPKTAKENTGKNKLPQGVITVKELINNKVYDKEVKVYGCVKDLGKLNSKTFKLVYQGKEITVWYSMMVNDDKTREPGVNVDNFSTNDMVIVKGKLKQKGKYVLKDAFWAKSIIKQK